MPCATRELQTAYQLAWMKNRRDAWFAANGPCKICGSDINLELDHKDPASKVTHRVWSYSYIRMYAELAKCQVLCMECHRKKSNKELTQDLEHGTQAGYKKKCRCQECKTAHSAYNKAYRDFGTSRFW